MCALYIDWSGSCLPLTHISISIMGEDKIPVWKYIGSCINILLIDCFRTPCACPNNMNECKVKGSTLQGVQSY